MKEIITTTKIDDNGNVIDTNTVVHEFKENGSHIFSEYARVFDKTSISWREDQKWNKYFLRIQERYANERLRIQGHLFLNEVYDMLGLSRTKNGQLLGWIYDEDKPECNGVVRFDFNPYQFENGIVIDFNVQGNILDLI